MDPFHVVKVLNKKMGIGIIAPSPVNLFFRTSNKLNVGPVSHNLRLVA